MKTLDKKTIPLGPASIPPGEILEEEFLKPLGMTQNELARRMGVGRMRISQIIRGERAITAETAILLGRELGTGPRFWLNLQASHDLAKVTKRMKARLQSRGREERNKDSN